LTHVLE